MSFFKNAFFLYPGFHPPVFFVFAIFRFFEKKVSQKLVPFLIFAPIVGPHPERHFFGSKWPGTFKIPGEPSETPKNTRFLKKCKNFHFEKTHFFDILVSTPLFFSFLRFFDFLKKPISKTCPNCGYPPRKALFWIQMAWNL